VVLPQPAGQAVRNSPAWIVRSMAVMAAKAPKRFGEPMRRVRTIVRRESLMGGGKESSEEMRGWGASGTTRWACAHRAFGRAPAGALFVGESLLDGLEDFDGTPGLRSSAPAAPAGDRGFFHPSCEDQRSAFALDIGGGDGTGRSMLEEIACRIRASSSASKTARNSFSVPRGGFGERAGWPVLQGRGEFHDDTFQSTR